MRAFLVIFAVLLGLCTHPFSSAWGCPQYPHADPPLDPDLLIEETLEGNGLLYRIFDLDQDGGRDYGLAFQTGCREGDPPHFACEWPLFYLLGDTYGPTQVFIDVGSTMGLCENIRLYWSKGEPWPRIQARVKT